MLQRVRQVTEVRLQCLLYSCCEVALYCLCGAAGGGS
jgi:hypothetical protein